MNHVFGFLLLDNIPAFLGNILQRRTQRCMILLPSYTLKPRIGVGYWVQLEFWALFDTVSSRCWYMGLRILPTVANRYLDMISAALAWLSGRFSHSM